MLPQKLRQISFLTQLYCFLVSKQNNMKIEQQLVLEAFKQKHSYSKTIVQSQIVRSGNSSTAHFFVKSKLKVTFQLSRRFPFANFLSAP